MTDHLEKARTEVVMRLVGQRNGIDLTRDERFVAREIAVLLNVLLLEQDANQ